MARALVTLRWVMPLWQVADAPRDAWGTEPAADGRPTRPVVVVDTDAGREHADLSRCVVAIREARALVVLLSRGPEPVPELEAVADVSVAAADPGVIRCTVAVDDPVRAAEKLCAQAAANPLAALTLTWLLRGSHRLAVPEALAAESAAYSMLLASSEFAQWLTTRGEPRSPDHGPRVAVAREGDVLSVRLSRPETECLRRSDA